MKTKKQILILIAMAFAGGVSAQQAVTGSGGDATGAGGTAAYSVGQVSCSSITGTGGSSNEGVHQPYEIFKVGTGSALKDGPELSIYPNPSASFLVLKTSTHYEGMKWMLYDEQGKLLLSQSITSSETTIPMELFTSAIYFLKVFDIQSEIQSFKIIKTN